VPAAHFFHAILKAQEQWRLLEKTKTTPGRNVKMPKKTEEASIQSAKEAGLRYTTDQGQGIRRKKSREGFDYCDPKGRKIRDRDTLIRLKRLAIPPAWQEVWICPHPTGHLQATGRDARGRKQYRYHEDWRSERDSTKYDSMIAFGHALPKIRRRVSRDLNRKGLPREKVLATVTRLLETTLIRVGSDEYARTNHSFGLTTMRNRHVTLRGEQFTFSFRGKSGKNHVIDVKNAKLAKIVRRCRDLPGQELFAYLDEAGRAVDVTSSDVNEYLKEITGSTFTAKDFRTWAGTVLAAQALQEFSEFRNKTQARRHMVRAIESVAGMLGNTPAICRKSYIHPVILDTYLDGSLVERLQKILESKLSRTMRRLRPAEAAVMMLLQQKLQRPPKVRKGKTPILPRQRP
jgi:DNA topoisomerase-1